MLVKICGVCSVSDARQVADAGADAIGLNFWSGSARHVSVETARQIVEAVSGSVRAVGVFVDASFDEIERVRGEVRLETLQFHGHETAALCARYPSDMVWKAVRGLDEIGAFPCGAYVLDASVDGRPGGTGTRVDVTVAAEAARRAPLILAGGLTPDNVAEAIRSVRPLGVDVASGVEARPGIKDAALVRSFVRAVRETS